MPKDFTNRPFDKLKKQIERRTSTSPSPEQPAEPVPSTDDELFEDAMTGVQEIGEFRVLPCAKGPKRSAPVRSGGDPDVDALAILAQIAGGSTPVNLSQTQEYVEWTNPTYAKRSLPGCMQGNSPSRVISTSMVIQEMK